MAYLVGTGIAQSHRVGLISSLSHFSSCSQHVRMWAILHRLNGQKSVSPTLGVLRDDGKEQCKEARGAIACLATIGPESPYATMASTPSRVTGQLASLKDKAN